MYYLFFFIALLSILPIKSKPTDPLIDFAKGLYYSDNEEDYTIIAYKPDSMHTLNGVSIAASYTPEDRLPFYTTFQNNDERNQEEKEAARKLFIHYFLQTLFFSCAVCEYLLLTENPSPLLSDYVIRFFYDRAASDECKNTERKITEYLKSVVLEQQESTLHQILVQNITPKNINNTQRDRLIENFTHALCKSLVKSLNENEAVLLKYALERLSEQPFISRIIITQETYQKLSKALNDESTQALLNSIYIRQDMGNTNILDDLHELCTILSSIA